MRMNPENVSIDTASVKVMRSYDYCHFEVTLSATVSDDSPEHATGTVDELRKVAARLADKAVEQYKVAKRHASMQQTSVERMTLENQIKVLLQKPESELSPEEKALLKEKEDRLFRLARFYDYEDDWDDPWNDD